MIKRLSLLIAAFTLGTADFVQAQPVSTVSYDSGVVSVSQTPANASHAAGTSIGGLFTVPIARTLGGSGIVMNFGLISTGGSTGTYVARVWQKNPVNTACNDNVAYAGNILDDVNLITMSPILLTPAAPGVVTGDSKTYANLPSLSWDYRNLDSVASQNLYVCIVTVATNTADQNRTVYVLMSGPQN